MFFDDQPGGRDNGLTQGVLVHVARPDLAAAADGQYLAQPGFDLGPEGGVGLDPVDDHDVVGLKGVLAEEDLGPGFDLSQGDGLARGDDLNAHGRLGHSQAGQDLDHPIGLASAVGAHGREDVRLQAQLLEAVDGRPDQFLKVVGSPGGDSDADGLARLYLAFKVEPGELALDRGRNIGDGLVGEGLLNLI